MATYLQGQADYISQIQPTEPNLAFDAQILQTKQSKYDANHKKVSELYGSLLNASMTRADNIQARDEFFKIINDDIRRMGSLDFSLDQNVQAAAGVFQSIYTNNHIVKDMVWTKNYNSELERSEAFKNCRDAEKCGGSWWPEGDKYLQYKRMEYKNASAGDALSADDAKFVPYTNVMEKAMKLAKDSGLSITKDSFSPDGSYIITTKNGEQLRTPLTQLFNETFGKDPNIQEMYRVKSYTERKDWMYNKISMGEYADENDASVGYFKERNTRVQQNLTQQAADLNVDIGSLTETFEHLKGQYEQGKIKEGSDDYNRMVALPALIENANNAKGYTDMMLKATANANNPQGLRALTDIADNQNAANYFGEDINNMATLLAYRDSELKYTADDFALKKADFEYDTRLKQQEFNNSVALEGVKQEDRMELENWKLDHGIYNDKIDGGTGGSPKAADMVAYETKLAEYENYNIEQKAFEIYRKQNPDDAGTDFNAFERPTDPDALREYNDAYKTARSKALTLKSEANKLAVKAKQWPKYSDAVTPSFISGSDVPQEWANSYVNSMYDEFESSKNKKGHLDKNTIDAYLTGKKGDKTKSVYYQLQELNDKKAEEEKKKNKG